MKLLFADRYYDTEKWEAGLFARDLAIQLSDYDQDISTVDSDIGHGADFPVVIVEIYKSIDWSTFLSIAGAGGFFLLGKQINEGIDGWIELAKKFKKLVEKCRPARIDEKGAALLVLNEITSDELRETGCEISVQIIEFTPGPSGEATLDRHPDALYLITVKLSNVVIVYGIKSNGVIQFKHEFSTLWCPFYE